MEPRGCERHRRVGLWPRTSGSEWVNRPTIIAASAVGLAVAAAAAPVVETARDIHRTLLRSIFRQEQSVMRRGSHINVGRSGRDHGLKGVPNAKPSSLH